MHDCSIIAKDQIIRSYALHALICCKSYIYVFIQSLVIRYEPSIQRALLSVYTEKPKRVDQHDLPCKSAKLWPHAWVCWSARPACGTARTLCCCAREATHLFTHDARGFARPCVVLHNNSLGLHVNDTLAVRGSTPRCVEPPYICVGLRSNTGSSAMRLRESKRPIPCVVQPFLKRESLPSVCGSDARYLTESMSAASIFGNIMSNPICSELDHNSI